MTSGPTFVALPPEKQCFATDHIAHMRPIFREEVKRERERERERENMHTELEFLQDMCG
jgi:hypothetical protein